MFALLVENRLEDAERPAETSTTGYKSSDDNFGFGNQYIQFYKNGVVEVVDSRLLDQVTHSHVIPGAALERAIASLIPAILSAQRELGLRGPVWIATTILDDLEYVSISYEQTVTRGPHPIGRKHRLSLPAITVDLEEGEAAILHKLESVFDEFAHAGGWDKSPNTTCR